MKPILKKDKNNIKDKKVMTTETLSIDKDETPLGLSKYQAVLVASGMGIDEGLSQIPFNSVMEEKYQGILQQNDPQLIKEYLNVCMQVLETLHSFGK